MHDEAGPVQDAVPNTPQSLVEFARIRKDGYANVNTIKRDGVYKHMLAAFIITASEYREDLGGPDKIRLDLPERWCRYCISTECRWRETCPLRRMEGEVNRYECLECGRRFTDRPGFEGLYFDDWVVLRTLRQVAKGLSPNETARSLWVDDDIGVSGRNVQRWVDKYLKMIEAFSRMLKRQGGDAASADEKHFKSNGKSMWFFNTTRSSTRFILSTDIADDKLNYNVDDLFAGMLKRLSRPHHTRITVSPPMNCRRVNFDAHKL